MNKALVVGVRQLLKERYFNVRMTYHPGSAYCYTIMIGDFLILFDNEDSIIELTYDLISDEHVDHGPDGLNGNRFCKLDMTDPDFVTQLDKHLKDWDQVKHLRSDWKQPIMKFRKRRRK